MGLLFPLFVHPLAVATYPLKGHDGAEADPSRQWARVDLCSFLENVFPVCLA